METFFALLALCEGTPPATSQRPVKRSFNVFFDLRLNKRLSKQSKRRWFKAPARSLWRHYDCTGVHSLRSTLHTRRVVEYIFPWLNNVLLAIQWQAIIWNIKTKFPGDYSIYGWQ